MKRFAFFLLTLSLLALALAGCAPAAPSALTDGLGREVKLDAVPQRIVSLAPSNTELLFALGAGEQVVGRDDFSDYPEAAKALPAAGGSMGDYNYETIVSLKPDLVLMTGINTPEQVKALEDLGITVYYLPNPVSLDDLFVNIETVGKLTGRGAEAEKLAADLRARLQAVTDKLANVTEKPAVFYELVGSEPSKPWTAGAGTFLSQLIGMAGGVNIGDQMPEMYGQMSLEALLVANPQVILLGDAAYGMTPAQVAARAGWEALDAVKNARVLTFDDNLVSRPGPRLIEGLEVLAQLLHPELFK